MSLRRGKRSKQRTVTCRPCLVWTDESPEEGHRGVVLDLTPHGMLVRMLEALLPGTQIRIQLMRDEDFREPLTDPVRGMVVRNERSDEGFTDHGVQLRQEQVRRPTARPVMMQRRRPQLARPKQAMHRHSCPHTKDLIGAGLFQLWVSARHQAYDPTTGDGVIHQADGSRLTDVEGHGRQGVYHHPPQRKNGQLGGNAWTFGLRVPGGRQMCLL